MDISGFSRDFEGQFRGIFQGIFSIIEINEREMWRYLVGCSWVSFWFASGFLSASLW